MNRATLHLFPLPTVGLIEVLSQSRVDGMGSISGTWWRRVAQAQPCESCQRFQFARLSSNSSLPRLWLTIATSPAHHLDLARPYPFATGFHLVEETAFRTVVAVGRLPSENRAAERWRLIIQTPKCAGWCCIM